MSTLDNFKKEAKHWLQEVRRNNPGPVKRLRLSYPNAPAEPGLRDIQHALAREHGYESWRALKAALLLRDEQAATDATDATDATTFTREHYESLANDLANAYASGDAAALCARPASVTPRGRPFGPPSCDARGHVCLRGRGPRRVRRVA